VVTLSTGFLVLAPRPANGQNGSLTKTKPRRDARLWIPKFLNRRGTSFPSPHPIVDNAPTKDIQLARSPTAGWDMYYTSALIDVEPGRVVHASIRTSLPVYMYM
jgi:hypothetical protein